jgi:ABC-type transport system substrate-binding protein
MIQLTDEGRTFASQFTEKPGSAMKTWDRITAAFEGMGADNTTNLDCRTDSYMAANGAKAWFGWPDDPEMEKLRDQYAKETDPAKGKALAGAIQTLALKTGQYGWLGQWYGPGATRANVSGWLKAPVPVMWNIEKK